MFITNDILSMISAELANDIGDAVAGLVIGASLGAAVPLAIGAATPVTITASALAAAVGGAVASHQIRKRRNRLEKHGFLTSGRRSSVRSATPERESTTFGRGVHKKGRPGIVHDYGSAKLAAFDADRGDRIIDFEGARSFKDLLKKDGDAGRRLVEFAAACRRIFGNVDYFDPEKLRKHHIEKVVDALITIVFGDTLKPTLRFWRVKIVVEYAKKKDGNQFTTAAHVSTDPLFRTSTFTVTPLAFGRVPKGEVVRRGPVNCVSNVECFALVITHEFTHFVQDLAQFARLWWYWRTSSHGRDFVSLHKAMFGITPTKRFRDRQHADEVNAMLRVLRSKRGRGLAVDVNRKEGVWRVVGPAGGDHWKVRPDKSPSDGEDVVVHTHDIRIHRRNRNPQ